MSEAMDGDSRTEPVPTMPGKNGGRLRVGGGRPKQTNVARSVHELIKAGAVDATKALLTQARRGNLRAIEMVLAYAIGRPTERVELSLSVRDEAARIAADVGVDYEEAIAEAERYLAEARGR